MKIISIDPGYERMGVAVLEKKDGVEKLLFSETLQTDPKKIFPERLFELAEEVEKIIKKFKVEVLVLEKVFFNKNTKTSGNISEIKGVLTYLAFSNKLDFFEYTPLEIKTAVCGYGRADKKQVIFMVEKLIKIEKKIKYDDEYDAVACGLTFFAREKIKK